MESTTIIDALYCIPKSGAVKQISDCLPFSENLDPKMESSGIAGAVLAPCNCSSCQHQWDCADRQTREILRAVERCPNKLRGLASYDSLRIGESLRWIDDAVQAGKLTGAFLQADSCVSGVGGARMYPLYGLCAKLRAPLVIAFSSRNRWQQQRSQVETLVADFPDLDVILTLPSNTPVSGICLMMQRFPRVFLLLSPADLQAEPALCEHIEKDDCKRFMFCSAGQEWSKVAQSALTVPLGAEARWAYQGGNAAQLFGFPTSSGGGR